MTVYGFGHLNMLYDDKRSDNQFWQRDARSDHQGQIFDIHGKPFAKAFKQNFVTPTLSGFEILNDATVIIQDWLVSKCFYDPNFAQDYK